MKLLIQTLFLISTFFVANSQSGAYDASFANGGKYLSPYLNSQEFNSIQMYNGGYLVAGSAHINFTDRLVLAKFNQNGQPDITFGNNGKSDSTIINTGLFTRQGIDIKTQSSGKLLVLSNNHVFRFSPNGFVDTTFYKMPIGFDGTIAYGFAIENDDKILVCGYNVDVIDPIGDIIRLKSDGHPDSTFGWNGVMTFYQAAFNDHSIFRGILRQPDGKYLVAGYCDDNGFESSDNYENLIFRMDANGNLDNTFNTTGYKRWNAGSTSDNSRILKILLQPDGKILLGGEIINSSGIRTKTFVSRLNSDGTMDNSFGSNGTRYEDCLATLDLHLESLALQNDGGVVWIGKNSSSLAFVPVVIKFTATGQRDALFGVNGMTAFGSSTVDYDVRSGMIDNNSKIVLAGTSFDFVAVTSAYFLARIGNGTTNSLDLIKDNKISIFPNPCSDILHIKSVELDISKSKISICDMLGRVLKNMSYDPNGLHLTDLSTGHYLLKVELDKKVYQTIFEVLK